MIEHSREELEQLARKNPQQLALIFAQKVARFPDATFHPEVRAVIMQNEAPDGHWLPNYLTDWTAVINAGKRAGIEWDRMVQRDRLPTYWAYRITDDLLKLRESKCIHEQTGWPDCAALIIVMIEVTQAQETTT